jgi:hypothetical protein
VVHICRRRQLDLWIVAVTRFCCASAVWFEQALVWLTLVHHILEVASSNLHDGPSSMDV